MTARRLRRGPWAVPLALAVAGCAGERGAFDAGGPDARDLNVLFWVMTVLGALVVVLVVALLARAARGERDGTDPVRRDRRSQRLVIGGGVLLPAVVLVPLAVGMLAVADRLSTSDAVYEIEVTGHQFWWEARYPEGVVTANEIHVPAGERIRLVLRTADVIHSFWVPELAGKTDMIPGEPTELLIEADEPGIFVGQCAEFCGIQHARMRLLLIAEDRPAFDEWLEEQAEPAVVPATEEARRGAVVFAQFGCSGCHTVAGTDADGRVGPDLTHLASRLTLGAVTVENERGQLGGWVADPHGIKPGVLMPPTPLSGAQLQDLLAYLEELE